MLAELGELMGYIPEASGHIPRVPESVQVGIHHEVVCHSEYPRVAATLRQADDVAL